MPGLSYAEAVERLYGLQRFGVKLGLEKISSLLAEVGDPQDSFTSCHLAGTNGKGTAAAVVDTLLRAHRVSCGLYTSPHLVDLRERIVAGGRKVPESFVAGWVDRRYAWIEQRKVTFFEAVTALAFDWFRRAGVGAASIEVGLGGRFDATNVIVPAVTVITSIGLEHTQHLGRTLSLIAGEKAGIAKPGVPLLCGERKKRAVAAIAAVCREKGAPLLLLDDEISCRGLKIDGRGTVFSYRSGRFSLSRARVPLYGLHAV
ncbi:MAG: bifunctional folylpolyglutamate synthase/dihydrofolate synthase, partial [Candidatus Glassbacteria bacterium]